MEGLGFRFQGFGSPLQSTGNSACAQGHGHESSSFRPLKSVETRNVQIQSLSGSGENLAASMLNIPQMAPCCGKCPETLPKQLRRRPQCRGQRGQKYCARSLWRLPCPCADIRHRDNFSLAAFGRAFGVNHLGMVEGTSRLASRFQSRGSTV